MPFCRNCGQPFEWGYDADNEQWVLLEPEVTDDDLFKSFVDENGTARADHRDRCTGGVAVNVTRLRQKIPPKPITTGAVHEERRDSQRAEGSGL